MSDERDPSAAPGALATDTDIPSIHVDRGPGDRISVMAVMMIDGRRAELSLSDWLDPSTGDLDRAARTALRRMALSFLEGLYPSD